MGQNIKFRLLESIGRVYEQAKDCKLHTTFFEKVDAELNQISDYFKVSRNQSLIIAMVFAINYKGYVVEINDLTEYFNCNPIKLLEFSDDFNALYAKGILKRQKNQNQIDIALSNEQFTINEKIAEAILNGKPLPLVEHEGFNDVYELLETFSKLWGKRRNEEISTFDLFDKAKKLVSSNLHIPLIKRIGDYELSIEDTCVYIYLIWNTVLGIKNTEVDHAVQGIFDNTLERVKYYQKFMSDDNKLINNNLIEIIESGFLNDTEMKLSAPSIKMLQECGIKLFANQKKPDNIIEPEKIVAKKLYFNEFEAKQVDLLKNLLQGDNCRETQNRLQSKGLPKGITVLLHGLPGTGKTETVFQIAKETDREIMKVDISQSKSMWFGESEKIIKRIFTNYRVYLKGCSRTPILFFNEADAIISKRYESGFSSLTQTENAVQNIILEELENFEGIFFATTNFAKNFDPAFERRFLFKIEFQKPDIPVKAKIWQSKLPSLSESECELLARRYDFSGGQIDNIVRKNEIYEVVNGATIEFNKIIEFCDNELLHKKQHKRIGYV